MNDVSSNGHGPSGQDQQAEGETAGKSGKRGFWLIVIPLVLFSVIMLAIIVINRPYVGRLAHAQSDLRAARDIAVDVRDQTGSFTDADAAGLSERDGSRTYLGADEESGQPGEVSVLATTEVWAAAVAANEGGCFYLVQRADGQTLYGGGTGCTGTAALREAKADEW